MLETQVAQLAQSNASRPPGSLPSQPTPPKDTANAITLRRGLEYDGPSPPMVQEKVIVKEKACGGDKPDEVGDNQVKSKGKEKESKEDEASGSSIPVSYPQLRVKAHLEKQYGKFMQIIKDLNVTVPFSDFVL